jgi:hypothetical protein
MSNVFVEPRPQGRLDGSPITDFVVEDHADHVLATFKTQEQTIHWARTHATYRTLHACATSTIRKSRITGGQYSKHSRAPNSSPTAPSRNYSLYVFASDVIFAQGLYRRQAGQLAKERSLVVIGVSSDSLSS